MAVGRLSSMMSVKPQGGFRMRKNALPVFTGAMLLMILAGCSGAPSGAFPKQAGPFTLVEGPYLTLETNY
jgi:hypothetical protein